MKLDHVFHFLFDFFLVFSFLFLTFKIPLYKFFFRAGLEIIIRPFVLVNTEVESRDIACHQALAIIIMFGHLAKVS